MTIDYLDALRVLEENVAELRNAFQQFLRVAQP